MSVVPVPNYADSKALAEQSIHPDEHTEGLIFFFGVGLPSIQPNIALMIQHALARLLRETWKAGFRNAAKTFCGYCNVNRPLYRECGSYKWFHVFWGSDQKKERHDCAAGALHEAILVQEHDELDASKTYEWEGNPDVV